MIGLSRLAGGYRNPIAVNGAVSAPAREVSANQTGRVKATADVTQAVLDDPATSFGFRVERLSGGEWEPVAGMDFAGGPNRGRNGSITPAPVVAFNAADVAGRQIRGVLAIPNGKTVRVGLALDVA